MSDHLISRVWNAVTNALRMEITVAGTAINTTTNRLPVDVQANIDLDIEAADIGAAVGADLRAGAALPVSGTTGDLSPNSTEADERLTVDATAGGTQFATSWHASTTHVEIDVQSAAVMVTFDDSAPTTTNGHRFEAGDHMVWPAAKATAMKAIRAGGTDAVLHASQMTT